MNDRIVTGLVRVKKKVEIKLFKRPLLARFASFVAGLLRNDLIPRYNKNRPPSSLMTNSCEVKKEEMAMMPKPATAPYVASAHAAPRPVTNPEIRPSVKVRLMVSTPIGPTGAAMEKPMINPLIK